MSAAPSTSHPPAELRTVFAWVEHLRPWSMVEIYLLGLFVGVGLYVLLVGRQPETVVYVADALPAASFVLEYVTRALPDCFPLPLGNGRHNLDHETAGSRARIRRYIHGSLIGVAGSGISACRCLRLVPLQERADAIDRAFLQLRRLLPRVDRDLGIWC